MSFITNMLAQYAPVGAERELQLRVEEQQFVAQLRRELTQGLNSYASRVVIELLDENAWRGQLSTGNLAGSVWPKPWYPSSIAISQLTCGDIRTALAEIAAKVSAVAPELTCAAVVLNTTGQWQVHYAALLNTTVAHAKYNLRFTGDISRIVEVPSSSTIESPDDMPVVKFYELSRSKMR